MKYFVISILCFSSIYSCEETPAHYTRFMLASAVALGHKCMQQKFEMNLPEFYAPITHKSVAQAQFFNRAGYLCGVYKDDVVYIKKEYEVEQCEYSLKDVEARHKDEKVFLQKNPSLEMFKERFDSKNLYR